MHAAIWVTLALAAGLALRVWMYLHFFEANGDTLVYGGIAKNLLLHGRYALTLANGQTFPTLIRLPGYPLFLAACFRIFGMENYAAVAWLQIALELAGCLLLADFARRIAPPRLSTAALHATLWLARFVPSPPSMRRRRSPKDRRSSSSRWRCGLPCAFVSRPCWSFALAFTFAVTYAALLRPDGALVAVALAPALLVGLRSAASIERRRALRIALVCACLPCAVCRVDRAQLACLPHLSAARAHARPPIPAIQCLRAGIAG